MHEDPAEKPAEQISKFTEIPLPPLRTKTANRTIELIFLTTLELRHIASSSLDFKSSAALARSSICATAFALISLPACRRMQDGCGVP